MSGARGLECPDYDRVAGNEGLAAPGAAGEEDGADLRVRHEGDRAALLGGLFNPHRSSPPSAR